MPKILMEEELAARIRLLAQERTLQVLAGLGRDRQLQVYLVGGTVRELLLGREIHDLDLAVSHRTLDLAETLAATSGELLFCWMNRNGPPGWSGKVRNWI